MVFLNPAILLGLIAASIPIIIHLLNLRKLQKVEFSTLSFLKELQKSKIKKIKIKQWLLLLIRTLIIIFLVLAFARPTLEGENIIGSTSSAKSSIVFLIDNSFSMDYIGENGTHFNKSKKIAKDVLAQMNDGDEFTIIYSQDSIITTTDKGNAIKLIDNLEISLITEMLSSEIEKAAEILSKSKNINKEIYCFSDFQSSTFLLHKNNDSIKVDPMNSDIKFYSFDLSSNEMSNYSISDLKLENSLIELNKTLTFTARIKNFSNTNRKDLNASLFLNNRRVAQRNVDVEGGNEKLVKFETSVNTAGLYEVRAELEEDNNTYDNISYTSFLIPEKIKILIYYEQNQDIIFIEKALNSISESGQLEIVKIKSENFYSSLLTDFDLIFLLSPDNIKSMNINEYISGGGNIVFIPSSSTNLEDLNEFNNIIDLPITEKIISTGRNNNNYAVFGEIDFEHPIYSSLFEHKNEAEIESPNIYKYIKFRKSSSKRTIIKLIDDSIFLGEYRLGSGKVIFLNSAAILEWNNLPIKGIFAPLISRIVYYLVSPKDPSAHIITGNPISINLNKISFPMIEIHLPGGTDKIQNQNSGINLLPYENTGQAGIYKFFSDNDLFYFQSVNVNPIESDLDNIDDKILENYYETIFNNNYFMLDPEDNFLERIKTTRYGTELWKYFIILVFFLALLEMYIGRSSKKDLATLK